MPSDNKILVRRFFDQVLSQVDLVKVAEIVAEIVDVDYVAHHPQFPQGIRGHDGLLRLVGMLRTAFPDLRYSVEELVEESNLVVARWSATGTHRGQFLNVPPTQRSWSIVGMDLFRIGTGRCVETWVNSDFLGLLQQLGAIPPLQPGDATNG